MAPQNFSPAVNVRIITAGLKFIIRFITQFLPDETAVLQVQKPPVPLSKISADDSVPPVWDCDTDLHSVSPSDIPQAYAQEDRHNRATACG